MAQRGTYTHWARRDFGQVCHGPILTSEPFGSDAPGPIGMQLYAEKETRARFPGTLAAISPRGATDTR